MEGSGPIPFHAASAYGVAGRTNVRPTEQPREVVAGQSIRPPVVDVVEASSTRLEGIQQLVAGTVRSDINRGRGFDESSPTGAAPKPAPPMADGSLHLYNRQADRMEAATGVAVGRSLDVTG